MEEIKTFEDLYNDLIQMGIARILAKLNDNHNFIDMRGTGAMAYVIDCYNCEIRKEEIVAIKLTDNGVEIFSVSNSIEYAEDVLNKALQIDYNYRILKDSVFYNLSTIREILSVLEQ